MIYIQLLTKVLYPFLRLVAVGVKMPVSSKILAAVAIIMLVIGAGIGYGLSAAMAPAPTTTTPTGLSGTIPIGVIIPLSGDFGSFGGRAKAALQVAEGEINAFVAASGSSVTFNFLIEDSQTSSSVTLTAAQSLAAKGAKVIIGGMDSGDLLAISQYVASNQIVVISGESTAPRTSIGTGVDNGSYIFRNLPSGEAEGLSLTQEFLSLGLKQAAAITGQRTYTEAIFNVFKSDFTAAGGNVVANVEYAPGITDYTSQLDSLESVVKPYTPSQIAIFCDTFEEAAQILSQAQERNSPLLNYRWIAPDSFTQSTVVSSSAGGPASKVKLTGLLFTAPSSDKYNKLVAEVQQSIGQVPDIYAVAVYDAAWLAVESILAAGKYDGPTIRAVLPFVADRFYGATGTPTLKPNGDRINMDQEFYQVEMGAGGTATWVDVAHYDAASNTFKWLST
jgi:branched-chain amino acid transport system substrate-binding protein